MKFPSRVKSLGKSLLGTGAAGAIIIGIDTLVAAVEIVRMRRSQREFDVTIVAAPGAGNIGDQALLEACLDQAGDGRISILAGGAEALKIPARFQERVDVVSSRALLYSIGPKRFQGVRTLVRLAHRSKHVWIIGADTMDGAYNPLASVSRFSVAWLASIAGAKSRVLGFSWNDRATRSSIVAAKFVQRRALLSVRDPISLRRIRGSGVHLATLCADIVFSRVGQHVEEPRLTKWCDAQIAEGRQIAVVNASGLISSSFDQIREYEYVVENLIEKRWSVVLLPHVSRPGNDDIEELSKVRVDRVREDQVFRVPELLSPDQVVSLAGRASVIITGRMHLAVLGILTGTYPITMSTQGKVEGLYEVLGAPHLVIEPEAGCGKKILDALGELSRPDGQVRKVPELDVARLANRAELAFQ
ncbi:polysaccharide pyruvyl transferase family protein [Rhodococcus sp. PD04]|uniref:polysaccharide pyruvyl transferase family protein n=1 Tax=Rhodococcus sp. PD04 TaxID=3109594 RepID=UPI002DDA0858|nr:polysaccharide pyruvyl transferase family protein [Rhodococcus sp. PD04]WSE21876.1 polysaccharide pyruvyl transferase family protein [Rhodococcus sp. PD04]